MKNWRRILVTGLVAGMVAVTGCSSNLPETNQGNRNGQRVVDAVNRRTDSYGLYRTRSNNVRTTRSSGRTARNYRGVRGYNRGFRRATLNNGIAGHRGLGTTRNTYTTRNAATRNTGVHNRGRIGHTFGYDQYDHTLGLDGQYGYDTGQQAGAYTHGYNMQNNLGRNAAALNNRVVRSTPARKLTPGSTTAGSVTRKATPTRKTTTTKAVQPTRSAAPKAAAVTRSAAPKAAAVTRSAPKTRSTTPKAQNTVTRSTAPKVNKTAGTPVRSNTAVRPSPAPTRVHTTHPMMHNTNNVRPVPVTPAQANVRPSTVRRSDRVARSIERRNATNAYHMQNVLNAQNVQPVTPTRNINRNVNPATGRVTGRRVQNGRTLRPTRAEAAKARRAARVNQRGVNRANGVNRYGMNLAGRGLNNIAATRHGYDNYTGDINRYGYDYNTGDAYRNIYDDSTFTSLNGPVDDINLTVPASASDDDADYAFFKRNKSNNEEAAPTTPEPADGPQVPDRVNRINPTPATPVPAVPAPTGTDDNALDDSVENIHDVDDSADDGHDSVVSPNSAPSEETDRITPKPARSLRRLGKQRAMK